jgi:hypothetical protein
MSSSSGARSPERSSILEWTARLGAVTAEALAEHCGVSVTSARARLAAAQRRGLVRRADPLTRAPALYAVTRVGLRAAGLSVLGPCTVTAANAAHLVACARVAAALESCYPGHFVASERELRRDERTDGWLHRPDLVIWPLDGGSPPVAVEVELTAKAPRRLEQICRAWARTTCVAGVLYVAPPGVELALERAIARARAGDRIVVVPLAALPRHAAGDAKGDSSRSAREPSQAARTFACGG